MNLKERKFFVIFDIVELVLSILVTILLLGLFVIVNTEIKYLFLFLCFHVGYNIVKNCESILKYFQTRKQKCILANEISNF